MKLKAHSLALVALGAAIGAAATLAIDYVQTNNQAVLALDGMTLRERDLPADIQSRLHDVLLDAYEQRSVILGNFAAQIVIARDQDPSARPEKLPPADQLLGGVDPAESELRKEFESHRALLPKTLTFEGAKWNIILRKKRERVNAALNTKREDLLRAHRLALLLPRPQAPIATTRLSSFPAQGPVSAPVKLLQMCDYLNTRCQAWFPMIESLLKDLGGDIRFTFIPYSQKPDGLGGALVRGAFCARQQGESLYWKYHKMAFTKAQSSAWKIDDPSSTEVIKELAGATGLEANRLLACLASPEAALFLSTALEQADRMVILELPTFFINGREILPGGRSLRDLVMKAREASTQ